MEEDQGCALEPDQRDADDQAAEDMQVSLERPRQEKEEDDEGEDLDAVHLSEAKRECTENDASAKTGLLTLPSMALSHCDDDLPLPVDPAETLSAEELDTDGGVGLNMDIADPGLSVCHPYPLNSVEQDVSKGQCFSCSPCLDLSNGPHQECSEEMSFTESQEEEIPASGWAKDVDDAEQFELPSETQAGELHEATEAGREEGAPTVGTSQSPVGTQSPALTASLQDLSPSTDDQSSQESGPSPYHAETTDPTGVTGPARTVTAFETPVCAVATDPEAGGVHDGPDTVELDKRDTNPNGAVVIPTEETVFSAMEEEEGRRMPASPEHDEEIEKEEEKTDEEEERKNLAYSSLDTQEYREEQVLPVETEDPKQTELLEPTKVLDHTELPGQTDLSEQPAQMEQSEQKEESEQALAQTEQSEQSEQMKQSEQTEVLEQSEQTQQMEESEQAEVLEQSEQTQQMEESEQTEPLKQSEQMEQSEQAEVLEQSEQTQQMEESEQAEPLKQSEQMEQSEQAEVLEQSEQTQQMEESEQAEVLEQSEQTQQVEESEQTEPLKQSEQMEESEQAEEAAEPKQTEHLGQTGQVEPADTPTPELTLQPAPPQQTKDQTESNKQSVSHANGGCVDREEACRLAERLYRLHGMCRTDVVRHLNKDNEFSQVVGEEYLKYFDFTGQSLDEALRSFLKVVVLIGETQERERVLERFSHRFHQCNPENFSSPGAVLTLTCALMLLNTDLHGQNVGKAMTMSAFVSNLDGMDEGGNFRRELLKGLYNSIKNKPLEWAVDEEELKSSMVLPGDDKADAPPRSKSNPFQDVPHDKKATVYKQGFLTRKAHADIDGKRTPWGKRSWKTFYAVLKGMVLYLQKDEYRIEWQSSAEVISVHHALAERADDYTKRPHVFRLQTADWRVFLFQAATAEQMSSWICRINLVSALYSSPPFPAAVGSQKRFSRPILPASQSALTLEKQLQSHIRMLDSFSSDLALLLQNPPEGRKFKARELEERRIREEYLLYERSRYEVYKQMLEVWKGLGGTVGGPVGTAELERFDGELCMEIGEQEEEAVLKKSHSSPSLNLEPAPPPVVKVRRNISERRTYRKIVIPRRNREV
ncbi:hypothetical protein MATL_G00062870 [Megalops atlanticus]|uniref:PH and SEC7 domain-containing protein 4 n=1 Tax=Megalops atlanticus TaxID=7932 RepID=A0A9D3TG25_MEGAT|nr:hypothetical protein MATL_G00062870 [Megalops atlanticus]